ncbi:MAG: hypothetical protein ACRC1K_01035, partial [Planctomycetia bacterium]
SPPAPPPPCFPSARRLSQLSHDAGESRPMQSGLSAKSEKTGAPSRIQERLSENLLVSIKYLIDT